MAQETIVLAGGCFWCVEAVYVELNGILKSESGYTGGQVPNPTYEIVLTGQSGHAEAIRLTYDPKVISLRDIFRIFFTVHDPTTLNAQGPDHGTQYRSAIFYKNPAERALALEVIRSKEITDMIGRHRIVTSLEPLRQFYLAEDYHQNYFGKFTSASPAMQEKMNAGYCQLIVAPKVAKLRKQWTQKLKKRTP
jgi:peptide-methionine (S)-S-oxide reductase